MISYLFQVSQIAVVFLNDLPSMYYLSLSYHTFAAAMELFSASLSMQEILI